MKERGEPEEKAAAGHQHSDRNAEEESGEKQKQHNSTPGERRWNVAAAHQARGGGVAREEES